MARPVFLTGMMGSGKTSVARALADRMDAVFVDLDTRIGRMFGSSIKELFEAGETHFRRCERLALTSLADEPGFDARNVVIATGGGVVTDSTNLATMHAVGVTVFLDVPVSELATRLAASSPSGRPLLANEPDLEAGLVRILGQRQASYDACTICIDGRGTIEEVVVRVHTALEKAAPDG